ncbi:type III secretion system translocon subunit SctB [Thalassospira sp. MA62]|nr:type III secretion system translocon subunit SctB [Thalassospira sp. MA62]
MNNTISNSPSPSQLTNLDQLDETQKAKATETVGRSATARAGTVSDIAEKMITSGSNSPTLEAPSGKVTQNIPGLLSKLPSSGDSAATDMYAVMALMHQVATENRMADREDRLNRMDEMVTAMESKVENMRKAADKNFSAAVIQGAVQIGAGMIQVGMAGMSMKSASDSAKASTKASDLTKKAAEKNKWATEATTKGAANPGSLVGQKHQALGQVWSKEAGNLTKQATAAAQKATDATANVQSYNQIGMGLSGMANGAGSIGSASATREAELAKADSEADQAHSDISRQQMDNLREAEQGWRDMMKDLRSQLEQMIQQDTQTKRNILQI